MILRSVVPWAVLAGATGVAMFLVKHEVQLREARLEGLRGEIVDNREAIRVLRAEWSLLSRPARVEELIRRHMDLRPAETAQIGGFDRLPARAGDGESGEGRQ